jgi:rRNA maturation endonuclease Nob1
VKIVKTLICVCHGCGIEYEITFNEQDYYEPDHCAGCGIDDDTLEKSYKD